MNPKLSLVLGILCISFSPIFVRLAGTPPITSAFYRVFIAWLLLAPYCITKGYLKINLKNLLIAVLAGLIFGFDIYFWNISLFQIAATLSTLIANLAPLWVGLVSFLIFRKNAGLFFWIGTIVAILGMIVLVGYQSVIKLHLSEGVIMALLASFFYAMYILVSKGILGKIATLTFMFYSMLAASVFLLIACGFQRSNLIYFSVNSWLNLLGMGIICQLFGWLTINHGLRHLPSTKVSVALLSQTVIAGFWAYLLLNEKLGITELIGSVIVLSGIAITFLKPKPTGVKLVS
jgi:drug/metabolite transporter (DMT)-like permease